MILTKRQRLVAEWLASYVNTALERNELCWEPMPGTSSDEGVKRLKYIPGWLYQEMIISGLLGQGGNGLSYTRLMRILDSLLSVKLLESTSFEQRRILRDAKDHRPNYHD